MTEEGEVRQLLGELLKGQSALSNDVAEIKKEHQKTREMVIQHRAGWRTLCYVGASALAVAAAIKGIHWGK